MDLNASLQPLAPLLQGNPRILTCCQKVVILHRLRLKQMITVIWLE